MFFFSFREKRMEITKKSLLIPKIPSQEETPNQLYIQNAVTFAIARHDKEIRSEESKEIASGKIPKPINYYAVQSGHKPGIYLTWAECEMQVKKFSGAKFKKFKTREDAELFMNEDQSVKKEEEEVKKTETKQPKSKKPKTDISANRTLSINSLFDLNPYDDLSKIYTDGAFNSNTKPAGWGCVTNASGQCILERFLPVIQKSINVEQKTLPVGVRYCIIAQFSDVAQHQNNGAELLALVLGLRLALIQNPGAVKEIHCDSSLLLDYWSLNKVRREKLCLEKLAFIDELVILRRKFCSSVYGGKLLKISGDDNPADLGYHVKK